MLKEVTTSKNPDKDNESFADARRILNNINNKRGTTLNIVAIDSDSEGVNAFARRNTIYLSRKALESDEALSKTVHELVHVAQKGVKANADLMSVLLKDEETATSSMAYLTRDGNPYGFTREMLTSVIEKRKQGKALTGIEQELVDEIEAWTGEIVLSDKRIINRLVRDDTTVASRLLNRIQDIKESLKSLKSAAALKEYRRLLKTEKLYLDAIEEAGYRWRRGKIVGINRQEEIDKKDDSRYAIKRQKYITGQISIPELSYIKNELRKIYEDVDNAVANNIAIEKDNTLYVVDSAIDDGDIRVAVIKRITIIDPDKRNEIKEKINEQAISKIHVSRELFGKIRYSSDYDSGSDFGRESRKELSNNSKESDDSKSGISQADGSRGVRGLTDSSPVTDLVEVSEETESIAPKFSLSSWSRSEYVTKRREAARRISEALGVSEAKARRYIDSINSVAKMIADDRARLDYDASPGSAFVSNVEYGGSFDYTTLCKKRRLYTGTFQKIQEALPDTALTADDILKIRNLMIDRGLEATRGLCYVEGSRANMGKFSKEFIRLYKRDNPDAWIPNMVDVNTPDGVESMRINHPEAYESYEYFWNHYGKLKDSDPSLFASQQKPKLYESRKEYLGEILSAFDNAGTVESKNLKGGIRMQSFSDFEIVHMIDTMQVIMDMSTVGLAGQAYTKVPEFAEAFGNTGLKINLSLIAKGVDADGRLIFDDREGMPHERAFGLRDKYSKNVGTIIVTFTYEQLLAAMNDTRIDYIIPFHRSQWKKEQYAMMGLPSGTKDYTSIQNEKLINPTYHEWRGKMVKDKAKNYMPNEYWDFSVSGKENAERYLDMCAKNNKRPKFYRLLDYAGDGRYALKKDGSTDGYWKLLIDFKMYDNKGNGSPQTAVKPDFSMLEIYAALNEYGGGHSNYPVAYDVVDEFLNDMGTNFSLYTNDRYEYTSDELTSDGASQEVIDFAKAKEEFHDGNEYMDDHYAINEWMEFYSKYQKGIANKDNFYYNTIADFRLVDRPEREPDFVSYTRRGEVSSEYWYTEDGVIRGSDHWGEEVSSCDWFIHKHAGAVTKGAKEYGFCAWKDFIQKTNIVKLRNGDYVLTNFENSVGRGDVVVNGKRYNSWGWDREDTRFSFGSDGKITADMTDAERARILSKKQVLAPIYTGQADAAILSNKEKLESSKVGIVASVIQKLGEDFGIIGKEINIKDVDVVITLSKSNLRKSITAEATPTQLEKLIPILKETAQGAIGVERHDNRYFFDSDTVYFDNLLGGYIDGNKFVPVRLGLKYSRTGKTVLYVVVDQNKIPLSSLTEIKKTEVVKSPALHMQTPELSRSVIYSLSQIIEFVNSDDVIRYIPDEMLTQSQKTTKYEAIAKTIKKTNSKNDDKYFEFIKDGKLWDARLMVKAAAKAAGYTIEAFHGSRNIFTKFEKNKKGSNTGTQVSKEWFFAADEKTANSYYPYGVMQEIFKDHPEWKWANPDNLRDKGRLYHLYLKMENPLIVDVADYDYATHAKDKSAWMEFVEETDRNGNDGIILLNAMDNQLDTSARQSTVYMFRESSQAKSADLITYNDDGDIIPISQRYKAFISDVVDATGDDYLSNYDDVYREGYDKVLNKAVDKLFDHTNDADMIEDIYVSSRMDFDEFHNGLTDMLGYDGIIAWNKAEGTQAITFRSNQTKDIFNFTPTEDSDIRFAIGTFPEQVENVINGKDTESTHLRVLENTPKIFLDVGLSDLPMTITSTHTKTAVGIDVKNKNIHNLSVNTLKQLPKLLERPAMIMESTKRGSIVAFVDAYDEDGNPVLCAIKFDGGKAYFNNIEIDSNVLTSVYGKETNPIGFIERAVDEGRILYWDKKMSQELFEIPGLQLPDNLKSLDSNVIIRKITNNVNTFYNKSNFSLGSSTYTRDTAEETYGLIKEAYDLPDSFRKGIQSLLKAMAVSDQPVSVAYDIADYILADIVKGYEKDYTLTPHQYESAKNEIVAELVRVDTLMVMTWT